MSSDRVALADAGAGEPTDSGDSQGLRGRPFFRRLFRALEVDSGTDYEALLALLLLVAIRSNKGELWPVDSLVND